jgi:hypothetical protein
MRFLLILSLVSVSMVALLSTCGGKVDPETPVVNFQYEEAVFNPQLSRRNTANELTVFPTLSPDTLAGRFESNIAGLALNPADGSIRVDRSEAGIRYTVRFIPSNPSVRPVSTDVIIGGIDYLDSVYVLSRRADRAFPIYNADRNYRQSGNRPGLPANLTGTFAPGYGFQTTLPSPLSAAGIIDMERLKEIILQRRRTTPAFSNPLNLTIAYTLSDTARTTPPVTDSTQTTPPPAGPIIRHSIGIQVYHFSFRTDIPQSLLTAVRDRRRFPQSGRSEEASERPVIIIITDRD